MNAGNYTLSEASKSDYTASDYSCVKNGSAAVVGNSITLALNDSATCTITNDDKPSFIVINKLSKGATGTFGFSISGPTPSSPNITTSGTPNGQGTTGSIPVNAGAYTVNESGLPAGWKLDASKCTVDGTTDFGTPTIVGGVNVSWAFTLPLGTTVTCTFDNGKTAVATRTQGFWSTHTGLSNTTWNTLVPDAAKTLCNAPITAIAQPGQNQLMGGFWSNIAKKSTAVKRLDIDQARMQMLQQYLAAVLNVYYFGSGSVAMLDAARTAYCATDINAIKAQVGILGSFNTSGDSILFTPGVSATAQASKSQANIPFWDNPTTH